METLLLKVKDPGKRDLLLALLAEFDFVEVNPMPQNDDSSQIMGYDADGQAISNEQLYNDAHQDILEAKERGTISVEDFVKEKKERLKGM